MQFGPTGPNFIAKIGPGKGGIFYLDQIFMKIGPAGPNFTAKIGPGEGWICSTKIQFLYNLDQGKGDFFLPRSNFYENWHRGSKFHSENLTQGRVIFSWPGFKFHCEIWTCGPVFTRAKLNMTLGPITMGFLCFLLLRLMWH